MVNDIDLDATWNARMNQIAVNELTTYRWSFEDDVRHYAANGITAIGVWREKLSDFGEDQGCQLLIEHGLGVSSLMWAGGFTGSDGRTFRESVVDALDATMLAAQLEASCLIVYSGAQGTASVDPAHDTWALDLSVTPPAWRLLDDGSGEGSPPGRRNGCASFDPTGPRLFIFGGTPDAETSAPGFYVFDARPGHEKWTLLEREGEPTVRSSGIGFYDPIGARNFVGFGNTKFAGYNDLTPLEY